MNKTLGVIIGILVVVGIVWLAINKNSEMVSNIPNQPDNGQNITQASAPIVLADKNVIPTDTTAVVTGKVTPNGAMTSYWYEFGTTPDMGKETTRHILGSGFSSISAPAYITGLTKKTTYYFRLNAENQYGKVSNGVNTFVTADGVSAPVGSLPTVRSLSASAVTRISANLNGEVTPNQADTSYWFEYGATRNLGSISAFLPAGKGTSKMSVTIPISNLNPSTIYYYRINAQNQFGTVNGSILDFETSGPPTTASPVALTLSAASITESTATLRGTVNPKGVNTSFWFEYSTDSEFKGSSVKSTENAVAGSGVVDVPISAMASPLLSNTTYYFRVVAESSLGMTRGETKSFKTN